MARVLITGVGGFAGYHLVNLLREKHELFGFDHKPVTAIEYLGRVTYRSMDINDKQAVVDFVKEAKPQYIFHLAALSSVAQSWEAPESTYKVNIFGELNLFAAALALKVKPRILVACSSQEYGHVKSENMPIKEEYSLVPDSPYAASKVCQDIIGLQYSLGYHLPVVRSRSFNHTGPAQTEAFVCSDFAKQIAEIEAGAREPKIMVGNLDAKRDFSDVRDVVRAYWMLAETGAAGEAYNVCSGRAYSAGEILEKLLALSDKKISFAVDPTKNRPSDIPILVGDNRKISADVGWQPAISIDETLADLLDWWRAKLKHESDQ